jgi:predicted enzyme related to lactoylglutathione lyase
MPYQDVREPLQRAPARRRYPILVAFLRQALEETTDEVFALFDLLGMQFGAMMTAGAGWPTCWTYYFNVPSIDAAKERIEHAGGTVTMGPHEVPGGRHIIIGTDPQGAAFALVGGR